MSFSNAIILCDSISSICNHNPGESYLDVMTRLDPLIHEIERIRDPLLIIAHRGIHRIIYAYFMGIPREEAPFCKIPLNTLIKLEPKTYFTKEERIELCRSSGLHNLKSPSC